MFISGGLHPATALLLEIMKRRNAAQFVEQVLHIAVRSAPETRRALHTFSNPTSPVLMTMMATSAKPRWARRHGRSSSYDDSELKLTRRGRIAGAADSALADADPPHGETRQRRERAMIDVVGCVDLNRFAPLGNAAVLAD
jgi:hypothetical protein